MKNLVLLLMTLLGPQAFAQTTANTQTYFEYLSSPVNLVKNPHARLNTLNTTAGGSVTAGRSAGSSELNGLASHTCTTTTVNSYCELAANAPKAPYDNANQLCEAAIWFSGSGGNLMSFVVTPSGGSAITLPLRSSTGFSTAYIPVPCNASQPTLRLTQTTAGTPGAIKYGMYYGPSNRLGSGSPENRFTAKVSAAGVVTDETGGDWINGNCSYASSAYTCTFTSNFFTSTPTCFVQSASTAKWGGTSTGSTSASSFLFAVWNNGGTGTNEPTSITCTKTGADYVQPAITPPNFNYSATTYSPTIANGPSCSTSSYTYSRTGSRMTIVGSCSVTGAGAAGNFTVSLPSGFVAAETVTGTYRWFDSPISYPGVSTIVDGASTISFFANNLTQTGNTFANGDNFQFSITVRVSQGGVPWTETHNAPQLIGSVTSNEQSAGRLDSSSVTCSGSSSVSGGVLLSGIGNISSGNCTLTFASAYSTAPRCWANYKNIEATNFVNLNVASTTTTGATLVCKVQGGSTTTNCNSVSVDIFCLGPR